MDPRHETQVERDGTRTSRVFAAWAGLIGRRPRWLTVAEDTRTAVLVILSPILRAIGAHERGASAPAAPAETVPTSVRPGPVPTGPLLG